MSMIRKKKIIVGLFSIVLIIITVQYYSDAMAARWKNTVITKLRQYQLELQKSMDFTKFSENENSTSYSVVNKNIKYMLPKDYLEKETQTLNDINFMYITARDCLKKTKKHIAKYLHKTYIREFSKEHLQISTKTPILTPKCKPGLDLIIILTTRPGAFYRRTAIRNSWGRRDSTINHVLFKDSKFQFMTIFTVGRHKNDKIENLIEDENNRFQDVLRLDYTDSYGNLVNKTMLTLEWVGENCQARYVLKTDDDCFVNIKALATWIQNLKQPLKYIGKRNDYMPVIRDPLHRNYVPVEDFGEEYYKPYCAGGGYMLSGDILKNLTSKSKQIKQIINEDAYVGMVTHALEISPVDDERFLPFIFTKKSVNKRFICDWQEKFLMHGVEPDKQLKMHWNYIAMLKYPSLCEITPTNDTE